MSTHPHAPKRGWIVAGTPLTLGAIALTFLMGMATVGTGTGARETRDCGRDSSGVSAGHGAGNEDDDAGSAAAQVVAAVRAYPPTSATPHAAVIALATAQQESGIRNLSYGDRDSLGVFQQRPSQGWGTPAQVTNVAHATTSFLQHLVRVPGWQTRRVTDVAADVQRPAAAYRGLYQRWVPLATGLTARLWKGATAAAMSTSADSASSPCRSTLVSADAGHAVFPVPARYRAADEHNWGGRGSHWHSWHTGTDFAAPCGTPVLAANPGTVVVDTTQPWAGRWLVKVVTGLHTLATWYGHMQRLLVTGGQHVEAGQQIGRVGDLGNATGCHLHFEVHTSNGSIYGPDNVDPSIWLARHAS